MVHPVTIHKVTDQQELEPTVRENIADYMDEFYATIGDPQAVQQAIIERCIKDFGMKGSQPFVR